MTPTRRQFLALSASTLAVAGCLSGGDEDTGEAEDDEANVEDWQRINDDILNPSFPMELTEPGTNTRLAEVHWHTDWAHWHKMPFEILLERWRTVEMRILDRDLEPIPIGADESHHIEVTRTEQTPADLVEISVSDETLDVRGLTEGTGELVFQVVSEGEAVFTSPALMIEITDE